MKLLEISFSILLIPALIAGPANQLSHDAKALLKKPRLGTPVIIWRDGTHDRVELVRVTDSFIAVRQRSTRTCENIDVSRIDKVDWPSEGGHNLGREILDGVVFGAAAIPFLLVWLPIGVAHHDLTADDAFTLLLLIPAIPVALLWYPIDAATRAIASHDSKLGSWESIQSNQVAERVRLTSHPADPNQGDVARQIAVIRTGHYRVDGEKLSTRYDGGADPETSVNVRFECDALIMDAPKTEHLVAQGVQKAQAPIVGRWLAPNGDAWEFHPDGTFQVEKLQQRLSGSYQKTKGGVDVLWNSAGARREKWQIHSANSRLFITREAKTTEFERRAPFQ